VLNNEIPYKTLLMHGFFVDEKGEKMSKSVGNFVPLEEIVGKYGADAFRLWALSNTVWDDLRFNWSEIREAHRSLGTIYNIGVFLLRFYKSPSRPPSPESLDLALEDRWLLSRLAATAQACEDAFEGYKPHIAAKAVRDFLLEDVSRLYMKLAKKRLESEEETAALAVLYHAVFEGLKLLCPIAPFISESVYQSFFRKFEGKESISLFPYPTPDQKLRDALLERRFEIAVKASAAIASGRQKAGIPLRWPLEEARVVSDSTEILSAIEHASQIIESLSNIRKVILGKQPKSKLSVSINRSKVGAKFKRESVAAIAELEKVAPEDIEKWLLGDQKELVIGGNYAIEKDMVSVEESAEGFAVSSFEGGKVYLKTEIKKELYEEAMVREVARRVQLMRKENKLVESDRIAVNVQSDDKELLSILKRRSSELALQVNAEKVSFEHSTAGFLKEWEIEDMKVKISIEKK
jgi:isoleucyl-tRNA synthetase